MQTSSTPYNSRVRARRACHGAAPWHGPLKPGRLASLDTPYVYDFLLVRIHQDNVRTLAGKSGIIINEFAEPGIGDLEPIWLQRVQDTGQPSSPGMIRTP